MKIGRFLRQLRRMRSVQHIDDWDCVGGGRVNFVFYFCPRMKSGGFWINRDRSGLETKYVPGISGFSAQRIARVVEFQKELIHSSGDQPSITAIFGSADCEMLFPNEHVAPDTPNEKEVGFPVIENLTVFRQNSSLWGSYLINKPWEGATLKSVQHAEKKRLRGLLGTVPFSIENGFVHRVFAGFALDGVLLRRGFLGIKNPVILGVESPGVPVLQNVALSQVDRLPVIQLR